MNPTVQTWLALILFAPWYLLLAWLYLAFPRRRKTTLQRLWDWTAVGAAVGAAAIGMIWGFRNADTSAGAIWKQVLATSISYGLFLLVLALGLTLRHGLQRWRRHPSSSPKARCC